MLGKVRKVLRVGIRHAASRGHGSAGGRLGKAARRKAQHDGPAQKQQGIVAGDLIDGLKDLAQVLVAQRVRGIGQTGGDLAQGAFLRRAAAQVL